MQCRHSAHGQLKIQRKQKSLARDLHDAAHTNQAFSPVRAFHKDQAIGRGAGFT
jgi:hypothetical protein